MALSTFVRPTSELSVSSHKHDGNEKAIVAIPNTNQFATCNLNGEITFRACDENGIVNPIHTVRTIGRALSLAITAEGQLVCGSWEDLEESYFEFWDISAGVEKAKSVQSFKAKVNFAIYIKPEALIALTGNHLLYAQTYKRYFVLLRNNASEQSNQVFTLPEKDCSIVNLILDSPEKLLVITNNGVYHIHVDELLKASPDQPLPIAKYSAFSQLGMTEMISQAARLRSGKLVLSLYTGDTNDNYRILTCSVDQESFANELALLPAPLVNGFAQLSDGRLLSLLPTTIEISSDDCEFDQKRENDVRSALSNFFRTDVEGVVISYLRPRLFQPAPSSTDLASTLEESKDFSPRQYC